MKKKPLLLVWQSVLPWALGSLVVVSTTVVGAPLNIDNGADSFSVGEQVDSQENTPEESSHHRQRRVIGGQDANWRQYPWLAGLEQIRREEREQLLKTTSSPSPGTTPSELPSTTNPAFNLHHVPVPASALPSLLKAKKYPETSDFDCSAILVDRLWAMTAAHCLDDNKGRALRKFVKLSFIDPDKDKVFIRTSRFYINHPDYRDKENGNDIAFILLDEAIDDITPVKIDWNEITDSEIELTQPVVNSCGWGRNKAREDSHPDILQCVSLNLVTGKKCNELYNPYKNKGLISQSDSELCAGASDYKKDTCYGDSGGPLFQNRINPQTGESENYIVGIISHGDRCAKRGKPGVYARISHFEHFGRCVLEEGLECDFVSNFLTRHQKAKLLGLVIPIPPSKRKLRNHFELLDLRWPLA